MSRIRSAALTIALAHLPFRSVRSAAVCTDYPASSLPEAGSTASPRGIAPCSGWPISKLEGRLLFGTHSGSPRFPSGDGLRVSEWRIQHLFAALRRQTWHRYRTSGGLCVPNLQTRAEPVEARALRQAQGTLPSGGSGRDLFYCWATRARARDGCVTKLLMKPPRIAA